MIEQNIYLTPVFDSCKSFYNKAYYRYIESLDCIFLYSYGIHVLTWDRAKQVFNPVDYHVHSRTTDRHIREFEKQIENHNIQ